jgi:stage II sporulation protein D
VELSSGRTVLALREDLLRTPVLAGSVIKVATLLAAIDSGVVGPDTSITCRRHLVIDGELYTCSHPDVGRPLHPAEALAYSCNCFFATVAQRLRRDALDRALVELGLPPTPPEAPLVPAALGLRGSRVTPDQLLASFVRLTAGKTPRASASARQVVLEGLRGAAEYGTASAFHDAGLTALAKTGTAPMPGGGYQGLVVAVTPADHPALAVVVMAAGTAGMNAAQIATERLAALPAARRGPSPAAFPPVAVAPVLRVGRIRADGRPDIVSMGLEQYVARVVSGEAASLSGLEARKALAIAARTFGVAEVGRHRAEGFDVCDLTHCQVVGAPTPGGDEAAHLTEGEVLVFRGALAHLFYTASCGGWSERPSMVWPGADDPPYLAARPEPACRDASTWTSDVGAADLLRALRAAGLRGDALRDLRAVGRSGSGRTTRVRLEGLEPGELAGEAFRLAVDRTLGWQVLKSTLFEIERTAAGYRFHGHGAGHGVGMCVAGSARLAAAGMSAAAILEAYYPGTEIRRVAAAAAPGARFGIEVPAGAEQERSRIEGLASDAVREFSRHPRVVVPPVIELVFHPSAEAYRRVTGEPWWTAGTSRGARVDLLPPGSLIAAGLLSRTLRHELAHVVTSERLKDRPRWVREGAAMFFAGELEARARPISPQAAPAGCPDEKEWRAAPSQADTERLYRRAAACYAAQLALGRAWDEVR